MAQFVLLSLAMVIAAAIPARVAAPEKQEWVARAVSFSKGCGQRRYD